MTITAAYSPVSLQPLLDRNGCPIVGGFADFYDAGTTTRRTIYGDAVMANPLTNPVRTDAFGTLPNVWVALGSYKVVLRDAAGATMRVIDGLPGGTEDTDSDGASVSQPTTGDIKFKHGVGIDDGWLIANGKTIGNPDSGATARANADAYPLYAYLWTNDSNLTPDGGRGASALLDFNGAKAMPLPDYRGRVACGADKMGAALTAGRLTAVSTANPDTVGTGFGAEKVQLTVAQLAKHTPAITVANGGAHVHTGTTGAGGGHNHGGFTDTTGSHTHPFAGTAYDNSPVNNSGAAVVNQGQVGRSTSPAGEHNHVITAAPDHTHPFSIASSGPHDHTATAAEIGNDEAHPNVQPSMLVYVHIKL